MNSWDNGTTTAGNWDFLKRGLDGKVASLSDRGTITAKGAFAAMKDLGQSGLFGSGQGTGDMPGLDALGQSMAPADPMKGLEQPPSQGAFQAPLRPAPAPQTPYQNWVQTMKPGGY